MALRTQRNDTLIWTLVAVAARLATALRLGDEQPGEFSTFELEIRRRLLFGIGILDSLEALDRGTAPLVASRLLQNPPLNINDSDMSPEYTPARSVSGLTDMSFTVVSSEAAACQHKLYEIGNSSLDVWTDWDRKMELLRAFQQSVGARHSDINASSPPIHRYQVHVSQQIITGISFELRRPPYQQMRDSVPPWDDFDLMEAAIKLLEAHTVTWRSPEFKPWSWKFCVPWPPLAVLLVEALQTTLGPSFREGIPGRLGVPRWDSEGHCRCHDWIALETHCTVGAQGSADSS